MAGPDSKEAARDAVESFIEVYTQLMDEKGFKGYDRTLMKDIRLIDADPIDGVTWELTVDEYWVNMNGVLHGGAYGVIFDMCTAMAMNPISRVGYWDFLAGVTRTLNISYLKAVPLGTTIRVHTNVIQHGKTTSLIRGVMESPDGKITYATAEHHKIAVPSLPEYSKRLAEHREERARRKGAKL
ncbi:hypothetical protein FQN54_008119 [Arachnomyces sp. PD_36]|nr:hypothetical protein FQN54_008119 [Arachnomyces sp. PD_36]